MPGVSGKMIRRRMDKSEAERKKQSAVRVVSVRQQSAKYVSVPTEEPKNFDNVRPSSPCSLGARKPMVRDLSSISEECRSEKPSTISTVPPLRKAFDFCMQLRRIAVHSS